LDLGKFGGARLPEQLRLLPVGPIGITGVHPELARDGGVLDIGDALRREQARKDMAVLPGLARGERSKRPDR
jgi:hypothetical protein